MGVIGEAAQRDAADEVLVSRREGGDAGHVPGCARDHALSDACGPTVAVWPSTRSRLAIEVGALPEEQHRAALRFVRLLAAGSIDREALGREVRDIEDDLWSRREWEGLSASYLEGFRVIGERLFAMGRASVEVPDLSRLREALAQFDACETASSTIAALRGLIEAARQICGADVRKESSG